MEMIERSDGHKITKHEIESGLQRILSSGTFRAAARQRDLLRFLVTKCLEGHAEFLKEYTIGVEVFRRGESFNPDRSAIVRAEARKLRLRLLKYYATEGAADSIQIEIPKGRYRPVFKPLIAKKEDAAHAAEHHPRRLRSSESLDRTSVSLRPGTRLFDAKYSSALVLPFRTGANNQEGPAFTQGLSDTLSHVLQRIPGPMLYSVRTAPADWSQRAARGTGEYSGADVIIHGRVETIARQRQVAVHVDDPQSGRNIWSEQYVRGANELTELQHEISLSIAAVLSYRSFQGCCDALGGLAKSGMRSFRPQAYAALIKARYLLNNHDFENALRHLEHAIAIDSGYAPPYVELAKAFVQLSHGHTEDFIQTKSKIRSLVSKALELDSGSGFAHTLRAITRVQDYDWQAANRDFLRGVTLGPDERDAHGWYATYLLIVGRFDEALAETEKASQIGSYSAAASYNKGQVFYHQRRFDDAIAQYRRAIAMDFSDCWGHIGLGLATLQKGSFARSLAEFTIARKLSPGCKLIEAHLAYAHAMSGQFDAANQLLSKFLGRFETGHFPASALAEIYIGIGNKEEAFKWLHKAIDQKDWTIFLKPNPLFDSLRSDLRFPRLLKRMNLE